MDVLADVLAEAAPFLLFYGGAGIAALIIQHRNELEDERRQKRLAARAARRAAR